MMDPFTLRYSYDKKKNTFNYCGNNGQDFKNVKQTLNCPIYPGQDMHDVRLRNLLCALVPDLRLRRLP